jgi:hypothetical protein
VVCAGRRDNGNARRAHTARTLGDAAVRLLRGRCAFSQGIAHALGAAPCFLLVSSFFGVDAVPGGYLDGSVAGGAAEDDLP